MRAVRGRVRHRIVILLLFAAALFLVSRRSSGTPSLRDGDTLDPRIGADDPSWKGLPWAPVSAVLARRPASVIEAVPKDPNYLYGRIVLRIDTENFRGSWATKYDRFIFHRATTVLFPPRDPKSPADYAIATSADQFNPSVLTRLGE